MRASIGLLFSAVLAVSCCFSAAAQKFQPKSILFKGAPEYSDDELLAASGLKKGTVLTVDEMNGHFKQLMDTAMFDNVLYKFDGQDLIYQLTPAALLYSVRLENLPLAPGADVNAQLHAHLPLFHGKVPPEGGMLESVRHGLEDLLAAQGIKATVVTAPFGTPGTKDVTAMNFSISAPPVQIGAIQLQGVSAEMQAKLKPVLDHAVGSPFDTSNSAGNIERAFEEFYVDQGYAGAKVHAVRTGDPAVSADAIAVPFAVNVEEGKIYKLGFVHLSANTVMTQAEVDKAVAGFIQAESRVRGVTLRNIWSAISTRYKAKGYLDCVLTPKPQFDDTAGIANYNVDIDSGAVYHLAYVKFENVSDDLRKLLMRNWQMLPGDAFDESYVANFVINAQKADPVLMRTLSGVKVTYDVRADPQSHDVNVVIRLQRS
jgi:outer membrane protein assembly factor BamA